MNNDREKTSKVTARALLIGFLLIPINSYGILMMRVSPTFAAVDRADNVHGDGPTHRDTGIHESGTGGDDKIGYRHADRRVFFGCITL